MSLQDTNLLILFSNLPGTLDMTPNEFAVELVQRLKIVSPTGTSFITVGDTEPTSNLGPWLKGGTQWWVFSDATNRYIPLDISESETVPFFFGATTPTSTPPTFWLRTNSAGSGLSWYSFANGVWAPFNSVTASGGTAQRPASPIDFQNYYDSDISVLIWWERGMWRTVSGNVGDVKHVAFNTATEALLRNPGWEVFGSANTNLRGRYISQATKDAGPSPVTVLVPPTDVAERAAFETFGEDTGLQTNPLSPVPFPPTIALWTLVKT